eukprot:5695219-Pleurochrysis_carterae.AAC.3
MASSGEAATGNVAENVAIGSQGRPLAALTFVRLFSPCPVGQVETSAEPHVAPSRGTSMQPVRSVTSPPVLPRRDGGWVSRTGTLRQTTTSRAVRKRARNQGANLSRCNGCTVLGQRPQKYPWILVPNTIVKIECYR